MSHSGLKLEIEQLSDGNDAHGRPFGYVNLDLAPFAELGPTARKYLLKDSKTNATIRVSCPLPTVTVVSYTRSPSTCASSAGSSNG
jgi:hypothetical protein